MKIAITILCFSALISAVSAQPLTLDLWNDKPTTPTTLEVEEATDKNGFVSNVTHGQLIVYRATDKNNSGKAVIICPGGAYHGVSMNSEGSDVAQWLSENGVTAAILKYRMPNGSHRVTISDAERAMEIMRDNAKIWGYSTEKIGVMGFSAGGHLASTMAVRMKPAFAVLVYPVISAKEGVSHIYSFGSLTGGDAKLNEYYSNELHITSDTPPTLLIHCSDDTAVPLANSELFYQALVKNGIPANLIVYPSGGHGWGWKHDFKYHEQMQAATLNFILTYQ